MTKVIEVDEAGRLVLPPELLGETLGEVHPHARYVVETQGEKIIVSEELPGGDEAAQVKPSVEQWEKQWRAVQEQVSASWPAGLSAVDAVLEQRR